MKLNLKLQKDGVVYYNNKSLRLQDIPESVAADDGMEPFNHEAYMALLKQLIPGCQFKWMMNDDNLRITVTSGVNRYPDELFAYHFQDGWRGLDGWREKLQDIVNRIRAWYNALPEETAEVEVN